MRVSDIDYARIGLWSHTDLAYIQQDPALRSFYSYPPSLESFNEELANRQSYKTDRKLLANVLHRQYHALDFELPVPKSVIEDGRTFTITTAHQPVLFTGPLFHIYKIAGTIHLARQLQHEHKGYQFLPVFVVGSEDHDWAEVNHVHLFGKTITWDREASGANGRLDLSGLQAVINEVSALLGNSPYGTEISFMLEDALKRATTYAQFHQALLIRLFRDHGLVVLDMDDPELKRSFLPVLKKEIESQFSLPLVTATQASLEKAGFKSQAFCRPVNLFYLSEGMRERLEPTTDGFMGVDSKKLFSKKEMLEEVEQHPERFSPNVILRPVYQEWVLPNLAYIGGGGELAYWLERKSQFEAAQTHFPMLIRRNSLLLIDAPTQQQIEKSGLSWEDLLKDYDAIVKSFLHRQHGEELSFASELDQIEKAYVALAEKAKKLDPTLATAILAEKSKQAKQFEQLGSRLIRAEKQHQETNLKRIQKLKEKLFPQGGLQERYDNMMAFYSAYGSKFIEAMVTICDPMEPVFKVVLLEQAGTPPPAAG